MAWAGAAGEAVVVGLLNLGTGAKDEREAKRAAAAGIPYNAREWHDAAVTVLAPLAAVVRAVTDALLERGELSGD